MMLITLIILGLAALFFVTGWVRADLTAICAALALVLTGVLTPEEALAGFSNSVVIMMAGLFIVGGGILNTGLAHKMGGRILAWAGGSETRLFVLLMLTTSFVGAFVSNTGTVALMMPIVIAAARTAGVAPSRLLMPLAFAGSLGGMLTLIGTPPNLIIRDALIQAGYEPLTFFSFTPVGLICIAIGIAVLIPLSRRFLGREEQNGETRLRGKSPDALAKEYRLTEELYRLGVKENSVVRGKTVRSLDVHGRYGLTVLEVRRTASPHGLLKRINQYAAPDVSLSTGDELYVTGPAEAVKRFCSEQGLTARKGNRRDLRFYQLGLAELLVLSESPLVNLRVAETDFRQHYGLNVLGVRRHQHYYRDDLKDVRLHAGDVVLVQGEWEALTRLDSEEGRWVVLGNPARQASRVTLDYKAPLAAIIMLLMVVCMAIDTIPVAPVTAVILAAVLMVFLGCLRNMEAAYKTINWESLVLFAAMLPMSTALEKTGVSALVSDSLVSTFGSFGPYGLLAAIYLVTSVMTLFISNTVTAVLMAPIALSAATHLSTQAGQSVSPVPFLFAVTVAASMCFASPFSTPPNTLVMSAGGYKTADYLKVGLPLQLVIGAAMVGLLPLLFPF